MHLHSSFEALRPSRAQVARILNREDHFDGAFARVVPVSESVVLKATSCPATNLLFEEITALRRKSGAQLDALPAVLKDYGVSVQDVDRVQYRVWEVERLFHLEQSTEMAVARVRGRAALSKFKPTYRTRAPLSQGELLAPLQNAVSEERSRLPGDLHWTGCAQLASAMAVRTDGPLREAFLFLADFVSRHQVELDMLTQGNILLDLFGQPVLSDPVSSVWAPVPAEPAPAMECLVLDVPIALEPGFQVRMEHRSTFGLAPEKLDALELRCQDLQVGYVRLPWGSSEQTRLQRLPSRTVSLWSVPSVANRLATEVYQGLLTTT